MGMKVSTYSSASEKLHDSVHVLASAVAALSASLHQHVYISSDSSLFVSIACKHRFKKPSNHAGKAMCMLRMYLLRSEQLVSEAQEELVKKRLVSTSTDDHAGSTRSRISTRESEHGK
jgi:hypothetical protein